MYFTDRTDGGKKLGIAVLEKYRDQDCVVYGLPRGGVITAAEVAKALHAPLSLLITRKIGHPGNPEYAIGAISEHGHIAKGPDFADIDSDFLKQKIAEEQKEILRRKQLYLKNKKEKNVAGKIAIIVDDGIATGLTMKAAIMEIKDRKPAKIIIAAAVMPRDVERTLRKEVDDVICLFAPTDYLGAVGSYYVEFPQVQDDEVIAIMQDMPDPIIFAFPDQKTRANSLTSYSDVFHLGEFSPNRFPNNELFVQLHTDVVKKDCVVIASVLSDTSVMELLLLCDTLQKEEAKSITCVLPYLPYSRQDANEKGKSQGYIWFGDMLRASGVDRLVTVDVHNSALIDYFPIALTSVAPNQLFAEKITQLGLREATIVAPDEGSKGRCQELATILGQRKDVSFCRKKREGAEVSSILVGDVSEKVIVVDDMLDTGNTLVACCENLVKKNVKEITIFVTHGFFTGSHWKKLWELPVKHMYCTDTVPLLVRDKRVSVLSIEKYLTAAIGDLYV